MQIDPSTLRGDWRYPTEIRFGPGRIAELADSCVAVGMKAPLVVTDPGLQELDMVGDAVRSLRDAGLQVQLFGDVRPNPLVENVTAGVETYRRGGHDGVVAFGGGSALDAGKAIALMVGQSRPLADFESVGENWRRVNAEGIAPTVAVPTTAGTGSEVGRASVIADEDGARKRIVSHAGMMPRVVLSDPELTVGLPPGLTAATGMDALTHCLEAFFAPGFHPIADGVAMGGVRLVAQWLRPAVADGADIVARAHMLVAATMGATAFQKGLGGVHSVSHAVGALYDSHHGLTNAIVLPYMLRHNADVLEEKGELIARLLGLPNPGFPAFFEWILELRDAVGIPETLSDIGVDDARADEVGDLAFDDPTRPGNPKPVSAADLRAVFEAAVTGNSP